MRAALAGPDVATHRAQLPERPAGPSPSQELTQPGALPPGSTPPSPAPHRSTSAEQEEPSRIGAQRTGAGKRTRTAISRSRRRRAGLTDPRASHPPPGAYSPALSALPISHWSSLRPLHALIGFEPAVSRRFTPAFSFGPACTAAVAIATYVLAAEVGPSVGPGGSWHRVLAMADRGALLAGVLPLQGLPLLFFLMAEPLDCGSVSAT